MRLTDEELNDVCKKYNVDELWSFSRFDSWRNSKFEYYLKYIKHETPQGEISPYSCLGGECHDLIEKFYNGEIKYEDLADAFDTAFATNIDMLGYKFNRSDEAMDQSIKKKYFENLLEFFKHFKPLQYKLACEKFVVCKVTDDIIMQGYIDGTYKDDDGVYHIVDWKTSSKYVGKAIEEHSHQLVIYSEALRQMGIPTDKIKCGWCFLKYVTVKSEQVNGKISETIIERRDIGQKLQAKAKVWLKKLGYEDQMEEVLNEMLISNSIDCLPDDVKAKFTIEDCYVEVENWQDIWKDLKEEIIETVSEIEEKEKQYEETGNETIWYDSDEKLKENSYYLSQLSDYSIPQLKDFAAYLEREEAKKKENEDLLGVMSDDTSWLDEL